MVLRFAHTKGIHVISDELYAGSVFAVELSLFLSRSNSKDVSLGGHGIAPLTQRLAKKMRD